MQRMSGVFRLCEFQICLGKKGGYKGILPRLGDGVCNGRVCIALAFIEGVLLSIESVVGIQLEICIIVLGLSRYLEWHLDEMNGILPS
jgi:hypothetical protein